MQEGREKRGEMGLGVRREGGGAKEEQHSARVVLEQKTQERMRGKHGIKSAFDAGINGKGSAQGLGFLGREEVPGAGEGMRRNRDHPKIPKSHPKIPDDPSR